MANTQNLDLVKPLGTDHALVSVLNNNSDKIDAYAGAVNASLDGLRDGLGVLADGNTHAAITSGQFVYVKNHQTLPQGLYQATTNIAANGTLSTSNLTADPKGGLNTLSEQIGTLSSKIGHIENLGNDKFYTGSVTATYSETLKTLVTNFISTMPSSGAYSFHIVAYQGSVYLYEGYKYDNSFVGTVTDLYGGAIKRFVYNTSTDTFTAFNITQTAI